MQPVTDEATAPSDAELISRVRAGDRSAFGDLYGRHARSAATLARQISVSGAESDDLVAESFARVLDTLLDGRGPDSSFRAYLFTTIRHTAYDRSRKDRRLQFTDDVAAHEVVTEAEDPVLMKMENSFVAKAFGQLPERWQTVLWHTQVEGQSAAEVGVLLGMSPNAVSSLAFRAREGLREAYLQVHMAETVADRCRGTIDRLGAWTRGGLSKREKAQVDAHLAECDRCPALAAELSEINSGLRGLLAPLLLGSAAAGYIATLPAVPALAQVGAQVAGVGTTTGFGPVFSTARRLAKQPSTLAAGVAAAAAAVVVALVIALTGNSESPANSNLADQANTVATGGAGTEGAGPGGSGADAVGSEGAGNTAGGNTAGGSTTAGNTDGSAPTTDAATAPTTGTSGTSSAGSSGTNSLNPPVPTLPPGTGQTTGPTTSPSTGTSPSTSASTPSSSTAIPPATNPPTTNPPATNPPTTSPPTTNPPTTSSPVDPTPANIDVVAPSLPTALAAGASTTVQTTLTNTGETASTPDQQITFAGPTGFSLVSATSNGPAGLRAMGPALRATALDADLCATGTCLLPVVAPGASLTVTLVIQITPDAEPGEMVLTIAGKAFPATVSVSSGYQSVTLAPETSPVPAGANSVLVLTATTATGTTNPGPLSFPAAIGDGALITAVLEGNCTIDAGIIICSPDAAGQVGTVRLQTVVLPQAASGIETITVDLPGGADRDLPVTVDLIVSPLPANGPVAMTGPFGGTSVGAPTQICTNTAAADRGVCGGPANTLMQLITPPIAGQVTPPIGARVVLAELVWAGTSAIAGQSLQTVTLNVDGSPVANLTGTAVTGTGDPVAGLGVYRQNVTDYLQTGGAISVTNLSASNQSAGGTPLGGWTLSVIWLDPTAAPTTVQYSNINERTVPPSTATGSTDTVVLTPAGGAINGLWLTIWAADPWGIKTLDYAGTVLTTNIDGTDNSLQSGYDLLTYSSLPAGNSGLVLTNTAANDRQDGLWIGPMLTISAV